METSLDSAIEGKLTRGLEYALYFNQNLKNMKEYFDLNIRTGGPAKVTLLHRAIKAQNYRAIKLLLSNQQVNCLLLDGQGKSPKDYCVKTAPFLLKYLRQGEKSYLNRHLQFSQLQALKNKKIVHANLNSINVKYAIGHRNRAKGKTWYVSHQKNLESKEIQERF